MRSTWGLILVALASAPALGVSVQSTSFQNGNANGYAGTVDRRISSQKITTPATTREVNGGGVTNYILDGFAAASLDEQGLIRFENIFGANADQIPLGAFILDATLELSTHTAADSDSGGPFGVARLLQPFSTTGTPTSYTDFPRTTPGGNPTPAELAYRGAWWQDGYSARPTGGYGARAIGDPGSGPGIEPAHVGPIIQAWSDGAPQHGMVIQTGFAGATNGWIIQTSGNANAARRPKLNVSYTTDPIDLNTFQQGANNYASTTMAYVRSGAPATPAYLTYDAFTGAGVGTAGPVAPLTSFQQMIDGTGPSDVTSPDDFVLIKFSDVFGPGSGQASPAHPVAKAWLVLTTGDASANARSPGPFFVHPMLQSWSTTSLYDSFGATPGVSEADGDLGPLLNTQVGIITGAEVWFDVTSYLEAVRNGAPDNGLAVLSGTTDGWQIHLGGASDVGLRPRLVVASAVPEPGALALLASGSCAALAWRRRLG